MDPRSGHMARVATGFGGAVNLAVDDRGRIYVAELFSGQVSMVTTRSGRKSRSVTRMPHVVAVEFGGGKLYASTLSPDYLKGALTGHGSVVTIG